MDRNLRIRMLLEAGDKVSKPLRDMAGGSSKLAQSLKATRDRLKDIERAQNSIAGFRELKAGLRTTGTDLTAAQAKVRTLAQQMAATSSPTKKLTSDFAKAKREAATLGTEFTKQSADLQRMRDRMAAAGVSTSGLAQHEARLRAETARANTEIAEQTRRLTAAADRAKRFGAAREKFSQMQGTATGLAVGGAAAIGTGQTIARPLIGAVKEAQVYQSAMTDIAQKSNMSRAAAERMGIGLLDAAKAANQLPASLQEGMNALTGFGLDPQKALAMMRPIGRAATAYKAEIEDLSKAAFAANDNLKVPVAQTARVIDIMAAAGKSGAFEIKDMAQYFPTLTAGYQALGQNGTSAVADLAAALQIARKGAGDSASAAGNLQNVLQKIASPATIKSFAKMGVDLPNALKKAYREGKTPLEAIAELTNKTLKGDLGKIGFLFEDAQVQQGLRPLIQNMEEYRRIRKDAGAASGTTDVDFAERMKDSAEQSKQLAINTEQLSVSLGTLLLPTVNSLTQTATGWANWMSDIAKRHPTLTKGVAILGVGLAALLIVLGGAGIVMSGLIAPFAALSTAATFFGVGMLPIVATVAGVIAVIGGLAAAAYLIYSNWGAITGFFSGIWNAVTGFFTSGIGNITATIVNWSPLGLFYKAFAGVMSWFGVTLPGNMTTFGRNMIMGLINGITGMLGALKNTIVNTASSAATWFKSKLGIHSPSRVFMGFGGHIMTGLSNGIDNGADGPVRRIDRLSKRLTAAMVVGAAMPAVAMASGVADGAGRTGGANAGAGAAAPITINVYPSAGMDEHKLAQFVAQEIERAKRSAAANQRASFADTQDWSDRA